MGLRVCSSLGNDGRFNKSSAAWSRCAQLSGAAALLVFASISSVQAADGSPQSITPFVATAIEAARGFIPLVALATAFVGLWSIYTYQTTYAALLGSLPPQFQDGLSSKFAFPEWVLKPSTPLSLQADYVKSQAGFCFSALGIAVLCFLNGKAGVGAVVLAMFVAFTAATIKSWKLFRTNSNNRTSLEDEG